MNDRAAAVRHLVYSELLSILPPASFRQTLQFVSNLAIQRPAFEARTVRERDRIVDRIVNRFCYLKVSPDVAETHASKNAAGRSKREIETALQTRFGERLKEAAGFFFEGRWKINLPEGCALHGYRSQSRILYRRSMPAVEPDRFLFLALVSKFRRRKSDQA
jgi:hypothetical protein